MDRRNWPWRKKPSEKSPGETESSDSISSYSERFSDEQQPNVTYNAQSPEVTSTTAPEDEENEKIKALTDKLSAALLNINAKEELVKQHAKVAEEAVAGWERAEKEVSSVKSQLDATLKKNSALDGALKECVRQLRQGKDDQERKIEEGIAKRAQEWESRKSELENQLSELRTQLEVAESKTAASSSPSIDDDLLPKLQAAEKENASMRLELITLNKKLEVTSLDRDLSTQSAETASKQHLESVRKIAKLESECRKLRYSARKVSIPSDHRSVSSQSDYGERLQALETESGPSDLSGIAHAERKPVTRSSEIVLMDDFLEMERLAGFPDTAKGPVSFETEHNPLQAEFEELKTRNADLEEKIRRLEAEKIKLEMELNNSQGRLKDAEVRSVELEAQLTEYQAQLRTTHGELNATKNELKTLQNKLFESQDQLRKSLAKLKGTETEFMEVQTQLIEHEDQLNYSQVHMKDAQAKLEELQNQLIGREDESRKLQTRLFEREDQLKTSKEQLKDAEAELMKLKAELLAREVELKRSQGQVKDIDTELLEMQTRLIEYENKLEKSQLEKVGVDTKLAELQTELEASSAKREEEELQVKALESEVKSLMVKVESLVDEVDKERALAEEITAKCGSMEDELSKTKLEPQFQLAWNSNADMKAEQEKEFAVAASKLEDCQKTIASLGRQLESLATFDDFLEDADSSLEFSGESPIFFRTGELGRALSTDCSL